MDELCLIAMSIVKRFKRTLNGMVLCNVVDGIESALE